MKADDRRGPGEADDPMADALFHSPKTHGFVRVAAATPVSHVGDPRANAQEHVELIRQAGEQGVDLMVFPELSLSAYAIDDLHMQAALLDEVERQIAVVAEATAEADVDRLVAVLGDCLDALLAD